jgi:hypothetical protein
MEIFFNQDDPLNNYLVPSPDLVRVITENWNSAELGGQDFVPREEVPRRQPFLGCANLFSIPDRSVMS